AWFCDMPYRHCVMALHRRRPAKVHSHRVLPLRRSPKRQNQKVPVFFKTPAELFRTPVQRLRALMTVLANVRVCFVPVLFGWTGEPVIFAIEAIGMGSVANPFITP